MTSTDELLNNAKAEAREKHLPYAGALNPEEAYTLLKALPGAKLVDVRTEAERDWVGSVPGALEIEWISYPGGARNEQFAERLQAEVGDKDTPLLFMCRSGARSNAAATLAQQLGYRAVYNVKEGFEGDKDQSGHRGTVGGWRFRGLPWEQK